MGDSTDDLPF